MQHILRKKTATLLVVVCADHSASFGPHFDAIFDHICCIFLFLSPCF